MEVKIGNILYNNISKNEYLNEIYDNILINYTYKLLKKDISLYKIINMSDALRFADILSKSTSSSESEIHKNWAQEIISLLNEIYPENERIKYIAGSVYSNTGNLRGLEIINSKYKSIDILENTYNQVDKDFLQINFHDNSDKKIYFFKEQKIAFNSLNQRGFSYSGPTSLGKSFVIKQYIVNNLINDSNENYCLIVPTK
ncbi:MAG: helicase, partial [Anaeroplasma sp.]